MKPPKRIPRISAKKLKALGGKMPFSSVAPSSTPKKARKAKPVGRGPMPQRRSKPKTRNAKRAKANHERAYGTGDEIAAVNNDPCAHCGKWPSQMAHLRNGGMSRKANKQLTLPLCARRDGVDGCHETFDNGKRSFRAAYLAAHGETMEETAARRWAA